MDCFFLFIFVFQILCSVSQKGKVQFVLQMQCLIDLIFKDTHYVGIFEHFFKVKGNKQ